MKLITKNTDYAVRALVYLANEDKDFISSREIAEKNHIPLIFMRRILQALTQSGIVETREGVTGGVRLARDPKTISITEVIRIFQGDVIISECLVRKRPCLYVRRCALRRELKRIEQQLVQEFDELKLSKFISDSEGPFAIK